ncbi:uncharacterized protein ACOB8E_005319 isoform 1-T1 [Sarcophilus harrisii]
MALGGAEGETEASFRELSAPRCHVATGLSSTCSAPSPPTVGPGLQPEKPPQGGPVGLHGRGVPGGRRVRGAGGQAGPPDHIPLVPPSGGFPEHGGSPGSLLLRLLRVPLLLRLRHVRAGAQRPGPGSGVDATLAPCSRVRPPLLCAQSGAAQSGPSGLWPPALAAPAAGGRGPLRPLLPLWLVAPRVRPVAGGEGPPRRGPALPEAGVLDQQGPGRGESTLPGDAGIPLLSGRGCGSARGRHPGPVPDPGDAGPAGLYHGHLVLGQPGLLFSGPGHPAFPGRRSVPGSGRPGGRRSPLSPPGAQAGRLPGTQAHPGLLHVARRGAPPGGHPGARGAGSPPHGAGSAVQGAHVSLPQLHRPRGLRSLPDLPPDDRHGRHQHGGPPGGGDGPPGPAGRPHAPPPAARALRGHRPGRQLPDRLPARDEGSAPARHLGASAEPGPEMLEQIAEEATARGPAPPDQALVAGKRWSPRGAREGGGSGAAGGETRVPVLPVPSPSHSDRLVRALPRSPAGLPAGVFPARTSLSKSRAPGLHHHFLLPPLPHSVLVPRAVTQNRFPHARPTLGPVTLWARPDSHGRGGTCRRLHPWGPSGLRGDTLPTLGSPYTLPGAGRGMGGREGPPRPPPQRGLQGPAVVSPNKHLVNGAPAWPGCGPWLPDWVSHSGPPFPRLGSGPPFPWASVFPSGIRASLSLGLRFPIWDPGLPFPGPPFSHLGSGPLLESLQSVKTLELIETIVTWFGRAQCD